MTQIATSRYRLSVTDGGSPNRAILHREPAELVEAMVIRDFDNFGRRRIGSHEREADPMQPAPAQILRGRNAEGVPAIAQHAMLAWSIDL